MKISRLLNVLISLLSAACWPLSASADLVAGIDGPYSVVHDFKNDWLVYSDNYGNYIPYTQSLHENTASVSLLTDLVKNRHYDLLIKVSKDTYLFIDGTLQQKMPTDQWTVISMDSLFRKIRKNEVILTLYGGAGGIAGKSVVLAYLKKQESSTAESAPSSIIRLKPKQLSQIPNFTVLILFFIVLVNALSFNLSPADYRRNINPLSLLENVVKSSTLNKPFEYTNFLLAVQYCLVSAFLVLFLINHGKDATLTFLSSNGSLGELLFDYIQLVVMTFVLLHVKYLFMFFIGHVLNLKEIISTHYLKIIQSGSIYFGALCLAAIILFSQFPAYYTFLSDHIEFVITAFYLVRVFVLYVVLLHKGTFINPYLFSYLCVTEVIPLIIGIKIAQL